MISITSKPAAARMRLALHDTRRHAVHLAAPQPAVEIAGRHEPRADALALAHLSSTLAPNAPMSELSASSLTGHVR